MLKHIHQRPLCKLRMNIDYSYPLKYMWCNDCRAREQVTAGQGLPATLNRLWRLRPCNQFCNVMNMGKIIFGTRRLCKDRRGCWVNLFLLIRGLYQIALAVFSLRLIISWIFLCGKFLFLFSRLVTVSFSFLMVCKNLLEHPYIFIICTVHILWV